MSTKWNDFKKKIKQSKKIKQEAKLPTTSPPTHHFRCPKDLMLIKVPSNSSNPVHFRWRYLPLSKSNSNAFISWYSRRISLFGSLCTAKNVQICSSQISNDQNTVEFTIVITIKCGGFDDFSRTNITFNRLLRWKYRVLFRANSSQFRAYFVERCAWWCWWFVRDTNLTTQKFTYDFDDIRKLLSTA